MDAFLPFIGKTAYYGAFNSLSQVLMKAASVGVPDFYRGCELWDFSMVDPDNRRPVDFELRKKYLREILAQGERPSPAFIDGLCRDLPSGRIKMFLTQRLLRLRNEHAELFESGVYESVDAGGVHAGRILAFTRRMDGLCCVTVAPRFVSGIVDQKTLPVGGVWKDTCINLPEGVSLWKNAVTGETITAEKSVRIADIFTHFPGAVLIGAAEQR